MSSFHGQELESQVFTAKLVNTTQPWTIVFGGSLDEHTVLSQLSIQGQPTVTLDFEGVISVNSSGLQHWIRWVEKLSGETTFVFRKVPSCYVSLLSSVKGMLPQKRQLDSFFVPYFDPADEQVKPVEFRAGIEFTDKQITVHFRHLRSGSAPPLEIDVPASRYFTFLKQFYPDISVVFKETL